nr:hypothetical protein [uncultured Methanoregula sp.]
MPPVPAKKFSARLVLIIIALSLLVPFVAGTEQADDAPPVENSEQVHQMGIGAIFFNKCLHICQFSYTLCLTRNLYKSPPRDALCRKDLGACNATCVESHTVPP